MMIGGHTTYDSITKRTTKEEDATGIIPLVQQQDHEVGAADGRRSLLLLFRRTIQTRSVAAILLVGILVGASVLVALSATDLGGGGGGGGLGGMVAWRSSSSRTDNVVGFDKVATAAVATVAVTSDYSCATEVQGAGPCCNGRSLSCDQVCDYLLMCDDGFVPEVTYEDDAHTQPPETSLYQPQHCHCRGNEDYNGCFCRQARDMIEHITIDQGGIGLCDACPAPSPPPTPSPTTLLSEQTCKKAGGSYLDDGRRNVDTSKPFYSCFVITENVSPIRPARLMLIPPTSDSPLDSSLRGGLGGALIGAHCWTESIQIVPGVNIECYPSGYSEDKYIAWRGTSGRGNDNCGDPCTVFDEHYPFDYTCTAAKGVYQYPNRDYFCYQWKDTTKYCWTVRCPKCDHCQPLGYIFADFGIYSEGWYDAWNAPVERSDLHSCGPPCTKFDPN